MELELPMLELPMVEEPVLLFIVGAAPVDGLVVAPELPAAPEPEEV